MEKVQFQLESTLPELKDLYDKGLFTRSEIDQITKRRTQFETALIRRVTRKDDFFKYAEYEINLERLRKLRWKKLNYHINRPPPSASTYSIPRRTLYILKRATAKFPGDLAVWLAYVEYAAREGMTKVVAKGLNSALQHHPLSPTLYLLLSYHHLHPGAPLPRQAIPSTSTLDLPSSHDDDAPSAFSLEGTGPARTTLLLGLRMLPRSHTLWREYVKLELGWVEALRRRWHALGLTAKKETTDFDGDVDALIGGDGAFGPEGEDARRAILSGQLVVHALESALDKVPAGVDGRDQGDTLEDGTDFRESLLTLLRSYPSPLRSKALSLVYADMERVAASGGRDGARARLALMTRQLYDRPYEAGATETGGVILSGVELVEALGQIGREIRAQAKRSGADWADVAGAWLAARVEEGDNEDLRRYLLSTLKALTKASLSPPASLLIEHLDLVQKYDPESYLVTAQAHAAQHPSNPSLQLARVSAQVATSEPEAVRTACREAAAAVTVRGLPEEDQEAVVELWRTWAEWEDGQQPLSAEWKRILRDSLRLGAGVPDLHPTLLGAYYAAHLKAGTKAGEALAMVVKGYQPTPAFFFAAFEAATEHGLEQRDLAQLYIAWKAACRLPGDAVEAALEWAEWLLMEGKGKDAADVVQIATREVRADEGAAGELEAGWKALLDHVERVKRGEDEEMESGSEEESEDEDEDMDEDMEEDEDEEMQDDDAASGDLEIEF